MPLLYTDDQRMLRDAAAPFLADEAPIAHFRTLRDANDPAGFSRGLWKRFGDMGFAGLAIPEADGGAGLGQVEAGIVLEAIGRNLSPSPFLTTGLAAATALTAAGEGVRARWLPGIVAGETVAAVAVDEGARHRPEAIALTAERSGNGFRLSGAKHHVVHGAAADLLIVAARSDEGVTLFAVPADSAGIQAEPLRLVDASVAATLRFDGVTVNADAAIGGADLLDRVLDVTRAGAAAEQLGVAGAALDLTVDYLKQRKQFGRLIGEFQALQHRAAHLYSELEIARAATLKAQALLDAQDARAPLMVAVAKAKTGRAAALAVQEGIQMHGGIGMTDAHDIGLYMKRQRALDALFGDVAYHADRVATLSGY